MSQNRKDSKTPRVNYDNTRIDKFEKDIDDRGRRGGKKRNRNGNKPRRQDKPKPNGQSYEKRPSANDFNWYNRNPELVEGAARVPFGEVLGFEIPTSMEDSVPGIMRIDYHLTVGGHTDDTAQIYINEGINKSMDAKYSFVVHANSRNQSYTAADLMLSQTMGASIISLAGLGIRAYGLMQDFQTFSKYAPEAYLAAAGFDYNDLKDTYSTMWWDINQRIAQMKQIWVADDFPLTERWLWMNQSLYFDSEAMLPQVYCFTPISYFVYHDFKSTTGTMLERKLLPMSTTSTSYPNVMKWSEYLAAWDEALESIIQSADRGTMYGDILKAYGENRLYALNPIAYDYTTPVVYNPEVLTEIENLNIWPDKSDVEPSSIGNITQDQNFQIVQEFYGYNSISATKLSQSRTPAKYVLNFHTKTLPTPADVMVATRLMCGPASLIDTGGVNPSPRGRYQPVPSSHGTEIVTQVHMYYYSYATNKPELQSIDYPLGDSTLNATQMAVLSKIVAFDWAPWLYTYSSNSGSSASYLALRQQPSAMIGDWANYTFMDASMIAKLHVTANYSLFGMPTLG